MAEINKSVMGSDEEATAPLNSQTNGTASQETHEKRDNGNSDQGLKQQERGQELPELVPHKEAYKGTITGLPVINLSELTSILLDPKMPSQKIMKEVADKIMLRSEESESDDGSVGSGGGIGMKGVLDCIVEVTLEHSDSDNSDDDDSFERVPREIPCTFCDKIFGNNMTWKTHVLVAHQDPTVLNIRRQVNEGEKKEKSHPVQRRYSKSSSISDNNASEVRVHHVSKPDKHNPDTTRDGENIPHYVRRSSVTRSTQNEFREHCTAQNLVTRELQPCVKSGTGDNGSSESSKNIEAVDKASSEHTACETVSEHDITCTDKQTSLVLVSESDVRTIGQEEEKAVSSPGHEIESVGTVLSTHLDQTSQIKEDVKDKQTGDPHYEGDPHTSRDHPTPCDVPTTKTELTDKAQVSRKRKPSSPEPESVTSASTAPSESKRSRAHVQEESVSKPESTE